MELEKTLYQISMAATFLRHNLNEAKTAETPEKRDEALDKAVTDALHIEELSTSIQFILGGN